MFCPDEGQEKGTKRRQPAQTEFAFSPDCTRPSACPDAKTLEPMKKETANTLRAFLIELVIYAVFVVGYFFLVLHFLGEGLQRVAQNHRSIYAGLAVLLMIGHPFRLQDLTA